MPFSVGDKVYIKVAGESVEAEVIEMFPDSPSVKVVRTVDGGLHTFRPGNRHVFTREDVFKDLFSIGDTVFFKEQRKVRGRYVSGKIVAISNNVVTVQGKNSFSMHPVAKVFKTIEEARKAK